MKRNVHKCLSAVLILVSVILAASSRLYAIDSNSRYFAYGVGQRTCDDYIKVREKRLDTLEQQHPRYTKDELYEIVDKEPATEVLPIK